MKSCVPGAMRAGRPRRLLAVRARGERRALLEDLDGEMVLVADLVCGMGLGLLEVLRLRVKDIDLEGREIRLEGGDGGDGEDRRDRGGVISDGLMHGLSGQLARLLSRHLAELASGLDAPGAPGAIAVKCPPAPCGWCGRWVFPATRAALGLLGRGGIATTMVGAHAVDRGAGDGHSRLRT